MDLFFIMQENSASNGGFEINGKHEKTGNGFLNSAETGKIKDAEFDEICKMRDQDLNMTQARNATTIFIPFQSNEVYDRGDAWRIWSCIYLAHLLHNTIKLLSSGTMSPNILSNKSSKSSYQSLNRRSKRGNYLTRRKEKFWWQTVLEDSSIED